MLKLVKFCFVLMLAVIPVAASFSNFAFAEETPQREGFAYLIDPTEQTISLEPKTTSYATVKVKNSGSIPINVRPSAKPFQVMNDNYDLDFTVENVYTKLYTWIKFPEEVIHLEPGETKNCTFEINVPGNIPGGGQYAAIILESQNETNNEGMIRKTYQLMSMLFAHVSGEEHVGGVLMNHRLPHFLLGSPFSSVITVKNDGNVDFRVDHALTIYDFFTNREVFVPDAVDEEGKQVGRATPIILPTTSRTSTITWKGAPQLGVFRAVQTISFLDENQTYEQIVFICPIWLAVGVLFLVALMMIWIMMRARSRRQDRRRRQPVM